MDNQVATHPDTHPTPVDALKGQIQPQDEEPDPEEQTQTSEDNPQYLPQVSEKRLSRGDLTRQRVVDALADPRNHGKTQEEIGKLVGITGRMIRNYLSPALLREVRALYHENHVPAALLDVDKAMLTKASKGFDVPAAKLMYQRFDGMGDKDAFDQVPLEINIIARGDAGTAAAGVRIRARRGIK